LLVVEGECPLCHVKPACMTIARCSCGDSYVVAIDRSMPSSSPARAMPQALDDVWAAR
jgi:hypothetical protein